jgi:hypothetical protein
LSRMLRLLVAVARLGVASIDGEDLRAPAAFVLRLEQLRWCGVKLMSGEEAGMRGEQML